MHKMRGKNRYNLSKYNTIKHKKNEIKKQKIHPSV